jgi:hypothetical protein
MGSKVVLLSYEKNRFRKFEYKVLKRISVPLGSGSNRRI